MKRGRYQISIPIIINFLHFINVNVLWARNGLSRKDIIANDTKYYLIFYETAALPQP